MFPTNPLDTTNRRASDPIPGPSRWLVLGWCASVALGIYGLVTGPTSHTAGYPPEVPLEPEVVASCRAQPPQRQLYDVWTSTDATEAEVSCCTLERMHCELHLSGGGKVDQVVTEGPRRMGHVHVFAVEDLKPDTGYSFRVVSVEPDTAVPRLVQDGHFHTKVSDPAYAEPKRMVLAPPPMPSAAPGQPLPPMPPLTSPVSLIPAPSPDRDPASPAH